MKLLLYLFKIVSRGRNGMIWYCVTLCDAALGISWRDISGGINYCSWRNPVVKWKEISLSLTFSHEFFACISVTLKANQLSSGAFSQLHKPTTITTTTNTITLAIITFVTTNLTTTATIITNTIITLDTTTINISNGPPPSPRCFAV